MGDLYEALITSSLKSEDDRKATHNTQGLGIVSASGVLATLMAGLTAFMARTSLPSIPVASRILFAVSLALFAGAAVAALLGIAPGPYFGLDPDYLRQKVTREGWEEWDQEPNRATWEIQARRVEFLDQAHRLNTRRGRLIQVAIGIEVLGVLSLVAGTSVLVLR